MLSQTLLYRRRWKVAQILSWLPNLIWTSKLLHTVSLVVGVIFLCLTLNYDIRRHVAVLHRSLQRPSRVPTPTLAQEVADIGNYASMPPYNFSFLINNKDLCRIRSSVNVLIFAYTSPQDFEHRQLIRHTWGNQSLLSLLRTVVVFPLGVSASSMVQERISHESHQYGDILQADFMDAYRNLTYKGILMLRWASTYCKGAKFLLKVDIDVFVNIHAVVPFLVSKYGQESRFMGCKVHWRSTVMRPGEWCGKWCVTISEYRAKFYPPYCWGSVYVISGDLLTALRTAMSRVPVWWIADVYLTGIVPRTVGDVKHFVLREYLEEDSDYLMTRLASHPASVLFGFIRGMEDIRRAWHIATQNPPYHWTNLN